MKGQFKLLLTVLSEHQNDFIEGQSTADCIFAIWQLIDYNLEAHILLTDYRKIFDKVIQSKSWHILQ
jgi:hypothetical protein